MKRPLAAIGLIYLATSAAAVCLFPEINFILSVMAAIAAIAASFIVREKARDIVISLSPVVIAFLVIGCCQMSAESLSEQLNQKSCVISGEICEIPRKRYGRWRYVVETDRIELPSVKQKIRILITSRASLEEAREGDRITCPVTFLPSDAETGYNSATSLRADGIAARAWCSPYGDYTVTRGKAGIRYFPQTIKRAIISVIRKALPQRASAMLCGMLLGETDDMDSRVIQNFRSTGIAHLLAVSGLHLTLLTLALQKLLRRLKQSKRSASVWCIVFLLLFMAVTGFPPSVVRAGVMHIMVNIAQLLYRNPDSPTSMSVAILILCIGNPWAAADIGLQLSVCSTLGLMLTSDRIYRSMLKATKKLLNRVGIQPEGLKSRKCGKHILGSLAATVAASTAILPLTAIHFGSVPLISPLTNLLCVYAASAFIILGILASLICCIPAVGWLIAIPLRLAAALLCAYLEAVSGGLAGMPFSVLHTGFPYTPYLFLFIVLLIGFALIVNIRSENSSKEFGRRLRRFVLCEIAVLLFAAMFSHQLFDTGAEIIIFGADGSLGVCARNRTHAVLAESGVNSYDWLEITETLRSKGVRKVDAVAVSDDSMNRSGSLNALVTNFSPDCLITDIQPGTKPKVQTAPYGSGVYLRGRSLGISTFKDPEGKKWQKLTCGDAVALICPEKGNCIFLPDDWRRCDAAIIGEDITGLAVVQVGAIIVTAKENNAAKVCMRLEALGYRHIYSTAAKGALTLAIKGGKLHIKTAAL